MAFVVDMRWQENGEQKRSVLCYYDELLARALCRRELTADSGHCVAVPPDASDRDLVTLGWTSWDGLWICPTHGKDLPP